MATEAAAKTNMLTEPTNEDFCALFVDSFSGANTAPSALLDDKWLCRKCGKLAADHPDRKQQQNGK